MEILAMIPARLSSKRILRKNIRYLCGKPLIQYPIDLALDSGLFSGIWVTSEAAELKRAVEAMGVKFHQRPAEHSSDQATNRGFTYDFMINHNCDYVVMINTTSPLLRPETLVGFVEMVKTNNYDTILSVISEKAESFYLDKPLNFSPALKINSQMLEPVEKVMWALTAWKRSTFIENYECGNEPVFGGKLGKYVIPKDESCDLDTPEDWNIAKGILISRQIEDDNIYLDL